MEGANELLAIVQEFVNAIKVVFDALKELFASLGGSDAE